VSTERIERVDSIPVILYWLMKMRVAEMIDAVWHPHNNWQGLSYGRLAVLFLTYVLHRRTHHLAGMEDWVAKQHTVLEAATGWTIGPKEATDDRLGLLLDALGTDEEQSSHFQRHMGQHLLQAYALPTAVARYDTTTFSVHHAPPPGAEAASAQGLLRFGHSKDRHPDLVQFKQGLGTLDPAGVPLLTMTLAGHQADDPLYVPAWREMAQTIGHRDFLFVTDCKGAAVLTRATIDHEGGTYLLPLPMTGDVPAELYAAVANPPVEPTPICLADVPDEHGDPRPVGQGFIVEQEMTAPLADGSTHTWTERRLVTQSAAQAARQRQALHARLRKAEAQLRRLRIKKEESVTDFQARATQVLHQRQVTDWLTVQVEETVTERKRYLGRGRPGPHRPYQMVAERQVHLQVHRNEAAIAKALTLAGWRIYVTNTTTAQLPLDQAIDYLDNVRFVIASAFCEAISWPARGLLRQRTPRNDTGPKCNIVELLSRSVGGRARLSPLQEGEFARLAPFHPPAHAHQRLDVVVDGGLASLDPPGVCGPSRVGRAPGNGSGAGTRQPPNENRTADRRAHLGPIHAPPLAHRGNGTASQRPPGGNTHPVAASPVGLA